jgi:hypothetical protein
MSSHAKKRQLTLQAQLATIASAYNCQVTFDGLTGADHYRWRFRSRRADVSRVLITSQTPSDKRADAQIASDARRLSRDVDELAARSDV